MSLIELDVQGMTCASCATRIEKRLNRLDGVDAQVNYATERATVRATDATPAELIATIERAGYAATLPATPHEDAAQTLRTRVIVAVALSLPVIVLAMTTALQFPGWQWVSFALTLPVVTWAAWPFHRAAGAAARHGATGMDTLISLGTITATGWSAVALIFGEAGAIGFTHPFELRLERQGHSANLYLEAAAAITTFLLVGRYLEARAKRRSGAALRALLALTPAEVAVLRDGVETVIDVARLRVGDHFVVRPGERIATDGVVLEGRTAVDAATVSGEAMPLDVGPGDAVVGGCVNTYGRLVVVARRVGADTQLAQIARMVESAQAGKAAVQRLADRVSGVFVPVVITLALATLVFWLAQGAGAAYAWTTAVAVLIIACPCALGLATPTALMVGTGRGAQLGILIKGPEVLEATRRIDTILLDKTGTVTEGRMAVVDVLPGPQVSATDLLRAAGAAESGSEHPIARAITDHARTNGPLPRLLQLTDQPGLGLRAGLSDARLASTDSGSDKSVWVGRVELFQAEGLVVGAEVRGAYAEQQRRGRTAVLVGWDGAARGVIAVADTVKPTSAEAVRRLRDLGLHPVLLTGDHQAAADQVAAAVGIDEVIAGVMPQGKVAEVRRLQAAGRRVAMVGDGVNDAAALAQADLGIAMGSGTDAAIEASDLTLVRSDLRSAADGIRLARATFRTIRVNLFWAFAYNVAALPLAVAGFLNPMLASAAMALSSLFVVGNSLRLRRFRALSSGSGQAVRTELLGTTTGSGRLGSRPAP